MREGICFKSKGLECRGWLYLPDDIETGTELPTVVMAHGFSAVKEQVLPQFAEKAANPKDFIVLPIMHFEIYLDPWLTKASDAAINWFKKYL